MDGKEMLRVRTTLTALFAAATLVAAFAITLVLPGTVAAAPGGSSAKGPQPYSFRDCTDIYDDPNIGDITTFCYQENGVSSYNQTPSGNTEYTIKGESCTSESLNGTLVSQDCTKFHYKEIAKDGRTQVEHSHSAGSYTSNGVTCTVSYNVIYTNGEVRHERQADSCA
jgi:hypothetical protein